MKFIQMTKNKKTPNISNSPYLSDKAKTKYQKFREKHFKEQTEKCKKELIAMTQNLSSAEILSLLSIFKPYS